MSTVYTAAQSIKPAEWNNIVDYVTIEMTKSAMETYRANQEGLGKHLQKGEANDYEAVKNIKSSINTPHYDEFSSHLTNWNSTKTHLVDKIQTAYSRKATLRIIIGLAKEQVNYRMRLCLGWR